MRYLFLILCTFLSLSSSFFPDAFLLAIVHAGNTSLESDRKEGNQERKEGRTKNRGIVTTRERTFCVGAAVLSARGRTAMTKRERKLDYA